MGLRWVGACRGKWRLARDVNERERAKRARRLKCLGLIDNAPTPPRLRTWVMDQDIMHELK